MNTLRNGSVNGLQLLYRGSLKSCNYRCSYCPFSKHRISRRELIKDREQWEYFVGTVQERAEDLKIRSLMVAPYGEALIHPWYWEGLGRISSLDGIGAAGAQTNLSFPVSESLKHFQKAGGRREKLYLWATFHPEMTTVEQFSRTCRRLAEEGIRLCAGAVGVPHNTDLLKSLRTSLPEEIYLWINRMDGLKRSYTQKETEDFLKIDPYFLRELAVLPADCENCRSRLLVEGTGKLRMCNISRNMDLIWDDLWNIKQKKRESETGTRPSPSACGQKRCSCYLAYGGRQDFMNRILFGPYPVFRIPRRAKAVFLDVMGTLIVKNESGRNECSPWIRAGLEGLYRDGIPLFFATTLPLREAKRQCREIWHLFSGGIFAGGAHLIFRGMDEKWEEVQAMEEDCLTVLSEARRDLGCRVLPYRHKSRIYKMTLLRPKAVHWQEEERKKISELLQNAGIHGVRIYAEENCLQILSERATKEEGVRRICRILQILPEDAASAGDSEEDAGMLEICEKQECYINGTKFLHS